MIMVYQTNHLQVHITPFVGRQVDLERLLALLHNPSIRLITILGTGGIGKTRLAIELAHILQHEFQNGIAFAPLAQLSTIDELLPTLADALGVQLPPGGGLQHALLDHIASKQMLLVLDNFEHLLEDAALSCDISVS